MVWFKKGTKLKGLSFFFWEDLDLTAWSTLLVERIPACRVILYTRGEPRKLRLTLSGDFSESSDVGLFSCSVVLRSSACSISRSKGEGLRGKAGRMDLSYGEAPSEDFSFPRKGETPACRVFQPM
jgi:hypothetical protein